MTHLNFRSKKLYFTRDFHKESYVFTDFDIILSKKLVNTFGHHLVLRIFGYFVFLVDTLVFARNISLSFDFILYPFCKK